jgi:hypothetical protein
MARGRLSKNARVADDAKIVADLVMARDLCRGGATGWADTRNFVMRRDHDKGCYRCGAPVRFDLPGTAPQGPTIDHVGIQVADVTGMQKGAARRALHDVSQLAVSHRVCNTRDGRGIQRPPTEDANATPTKYVVPPEPLTLSRKPDPNAVTLNGFTYHRGPGTAEILEAERKRFRQYAKDYVNDCLSAHSKPWPVLSETERQRKLAEVMAA